MGDKSCIYGKMRLAVCLPQRPRAQTIHSKWHLFCLHIKSMSQVVSTVHKSVLILKDSECFDCISSSLPASVFEGETFESWKYSSYLFFPRTLVQRLFSGLDWDQLFLLVSHTDSDVRNDGFLHGAFGFKK